MWCCTIIGSRVTGDEDEKCRKTRGKKNGEAVTSMSSLEPVTPGDPEEVRGLSQGYTLSWDVFRLGESTFQRTLVDFTKFRCCHC